LLDTNRLHESLRGAVDRLLKTLGDQAVTALCACAEELTRRYADDWGAPPDADLSAHAGRVALALSYHWSRFAAGEALSLPEVVDRVRAGRLSAGEGHPDVLRQVALVEGVCQWDDGAVRRFREEYEGVVDRLIRRVGGRRAEQEMAGFLDDLMTPRVKARTCRLDGFGGLSSLEDWLRTVVAKEYASRVRRDRLRTTGGGDEIGPEVPDPKPDGHGGQARLDEYRTNLLEPLIGLYRQAVAALGDWDRTAWTMIVLDGASQTEVARVFGVDKSTVSRHFNAVEEPVRRTIRSDPGLSRWWASFAGEPAWLRNDVASLFKSLLREAVDGPAAAAPAPGAEARAGS
jgi:DNA-directed RNA polymerase specialized sigma24 family protein